MYETIKNAKMFSFMSSLQTYCHFKLDFQQVEQHTGGKWLIHYTKRRKDNQLQSLELPVDYPSRECNFCCILCIINSCMKEI